jgi:hypothetical protein
MGLSQIRVGQVWSREDDGATYLVTRLYNEALTTFALLRPTEDQGGQGDLPPLRIRVSREASGQTLPGYRPTQSPDNF